ncbi:MAG: hypothetical protein KC800_31060, partial [Candidatus Eremiobacteraeota bacterium]|nr:hypothetical protein [Candidatus Eremiobacteraeota bacterium]
MMLLLVIGFTTAAGLITHQNYTNAAGRERVLQARYAVRSGLATAMDQLNTDPTWAPTQASPYEAYLDPQNEVGFRVWLEGINLDSDTPVASSSGEMLERGQAALKVIALINGREISTGFGGAERSVIMMRPPVKFDHNVFDLASPILCDSPAGAVYLSYDSSAGVLPHTAGAPPAANSNASVRSLEDLSMGGSTQVYGELVMSPNSTIYNAGSYSSLRVLDEMEVPLRFITPQGVNEDAPAPDQYINADMSLAPGVYGDLYVTAGTTLTLERGGEYAFLGTVGLIKLDAGARIVVDGATTDPCVIYSHGLFTGPNCRMNIPSAPGDPPRPAELQFYNVGWKGCDEFEIELGDGSEGAFVMAGDNARYYIRDNVKVFGALYGILMHVGGGTQFHYDSSLAGRILEGRSQWILINQGQ